MGNVKTAISLDEAVFQQVEDLAHELNVSRSRLVSLALEEFLRRRQNRRLLEQINAAVKGGPDLDEAAVISGMRRRHRKLLEGDWSAENDDQPG